MASLTYIRRLRDRAVLLPLPATPYEACEKRAARVSSLSLVRYRGNDYSVPTAYGHREVLVRGYVHEVVIACGAAEIARHPRSYEREDFIFDPLQLPGGAGWIRNAGVEGSLSEGKPARILEKFRVENRIASSREQVRCQFGADARR